MHPSTPMTTDFIAPLTDIGFILVSGTDAAQFLHNQLTNDVLHLSQSDVRLAGYCSPKGRLLATLMIWKHHDIYVIQLPRAIQATIQKRLNTFVLRSKVTLSDGSDQFSALGLSGNPLTTPLIDTLTRWFSDLPSIPYQKIDTEAGSLIRLSDADHMPRYQWITTTDQALILWPTLIQTDPTAALNRWRLSEIHAGIPTLTAETQDQFIPQTLNFELIGGVNFKKGCYPGQEIVARTQYLGKLKRRMTLASINTTQLDQVLPGTELFSGHDASQPCGQIIQAALNLQGGIDCLITLQLTAFPHNTIHLSSSQGDTMTLKTLPYALPELSNNP